MLYSSTHMATVGVKGLTLPYKSLVMTIYSYHRLSTVIMFIMPHCS